MARRRARPVPTQQRRRGRGRLRYVAVIAVALLAGAGTAFAFWSRDEPSVPLAGVPEAYRIVYRVDEFVSKPTRVVTEVIEIERVESVGRRLRLDGPPPGVSVEGGDLASSDGNYLVRNRRPGTDAFILQPRDGSAPAFDLRLEVSIPLAVDAGTVRKGATRDTDVGRCTEYLTKEPIDVGRWEPPTDADEVRTCLTSDWLVAIEDITISKKLARTRTAVTIERALPDDYDVFDGIAKSSQEGPQMVGVRKLDKPGDPIVVEPPKPPGGLRRTGLFQVALLQPSPTGSSISAIEEQHVFTGRGHTVVLSQIRELDRSLTPTERGEEIDLGVLGEGRIELGPHGLTVSFFGDGERLRVSSTMPRAETLAWVRALKPDVDDPIPTAS